MSGIYIHIPYCKVKCHYCDFHFSTNAANSSEMIEALCAEIHQRSNYLSKDKITTIYFGGGTPSILESSQIDQILEKIDQTFSIEDNVEITFECNPDDLNGKTLELLKAIGINRLSVGVQSFDDEVLSFMNRAHNAQQAIDVLKLAQDKGFDNITADLIYGIPDRDLKHWEKQLNQMLDLNIPHISAYCLTIEPKTVFGHKHRYGELTIPSDEETLAQFVMMVDRLMSSDYQHYEISNFAKEGYISKHNSSYWLGKPYLGLGPSAHSYNINERGWNISNNHEYIRRIFGGDKYHDVEKLTAKDKFNDYILTRIRTHWGLVVNELEIFGADLDLTEFRKDLLRHLELQNIIQVNGIIRLSSTGKFIADRIASDLFI